MNKRIGDKIGFYRTVKKGNSTQVKPARGKIWSIKNGGRLVIIEFRGCLYERKPEDLRHITKRV